MAAANWSLCADQFLCSICLDLLTDPVSTPCGHNFCQTCIADHWNSNDQCVCPLCAKVFSIRPELQVNTLLSDVVSRVSRAQQEAGRRSERHVSTPGGVPCDVCTGTRVRALKSCLDCLVSYCETHLEPHLAASRLKRHQLIQPVENLEGRMSSIFFHHLHLLQSAQSIRQSPPTKYVSYERAVVEAVELEETFSDQMKKVQQFAVDVTLDPGTAHPNLVLTDDGKRVSHVDVKKKVPDKPGRFSLCPCVLGKQSFSSGRFYFEVQVRRKTGWDLGVASESSSRKGKITLSPRNGYWTIWLRNGCEYEALASPPVRLSPRSPPQRVGVFVDYEEGLVSFYDVDAADYRLIYSFTGCSFTEKLLPFFAPGLNYDGENSAPLIISPVNQTE